MKKILILLLCMIFALSLVACGANEAELNAQYKAGYNEGYADGLETGSASSSGYYEDEYYIASKVLKNASYELGSEIYNMEQDLKKLYGVSPRYLIGMFEDLAAGERFTSEQLEYASMLLDDYISCVEALPNFILDLD